MLRSSAVPLAILAFALSAAPLHAGGWGDRSYAVQPTTVGGSVASSISDWR